MSQKFLGNQQFLWVSTLIDVFLLVSEWEVMAYVVGQGTELLNQRDSTGILYQGYEKDWHWCSFEENGVQGRNERYEFRCDVSLECCGRVCCIPEETGIPLWLLLLFLLLGLLLLAALLSLLWYLCSQLRKRKKKEVSSGGYRSIRHAEGNYADVDTKRLVGPRRGSFHEEETFEESFKEEIEYGDGSSVESDMEEDVERIERVERGSHQRHGADGDRRQFIPSPLEETLLPKPQPVRVVEHEDAISRASVLPEPVDVPRPEPLRAQHAVYRPFVADPLEETDLPPAERTRLSTHDLSEIASPKRPVVSTLETPDRQLAEYMIARPGFDNVPSY